MWNYGPWRNIVEHKEKTHIFFKKQSSKLIPAILIGHYFSIFCLGVDNLQPSTGLIVSKLHEHIRALFLWGCRAIYKKGFRVALGDAAAVDFQLPMTLRNLQAE